MLISQMGHFFISLFLAFMIMFYLNGFLAFKGEDGRLSSSPRQKASHRWKASLSEGKYYENFVDYVCVPSGPKH